MFSNLIESSADKSAFKRRSSFFLATVASYSLILFAAAIVGVLTYDAQVEAQTTEMLLEYWIPAVDPKTEPERPREPATARQPRPTSAPVDRNLTQSVRTEGQTSTNDPSRVPDHVGVDPSKVPPVFGSYRRGNFNADPPSVTPDTSGCVACTGKAPKVAETETPPLPPKPTKPEVVRATSVIIMSKVIEMPRPVYPEMAKRAGIQGAVNVQILIDETGKVVSAQAVKGSAMLTTAAVDAARRARFTPTKLGDSPVKVQGVITYNFVLQ